MKKQRSLKCLLVQSGLFWADAEANRNKLEAVVRSEGGGHDLVVFPETFTSGFMGDLGAEPETMDGETIKWMKSLSNETGCVLCGSVAIATGKGKANRFLWVTPDGGVEYYDKRHLFSFAGEDKRYISGDERKVLRYRGWRICPQVCYDLRFPVWCRNRDDYDVLLFVANWPEPRTPAWTALLKARAIENQCYVIGVNRSGTDPRGLEYSGASAMYGPLGETVVDLGVEECTGSAIMNLEIIRKVRRKLPFQQDADSFKLQ